MGQAARETIKYGIVAFLACYGFASLAADIEEYLTTSTLCQVAGFRQLPPQ